MGRILALPIQEKAQEKVYAIVCYRLVKYYVVSEAFGASAPQAFFVRCYFLALQAHCCLLLCKSCIV